MQALHKIVLPCGVKLSARNPVTFHQPSCEQQWKRSLESLEDKHVFGIQESPPILFIIVSSNGCTWFFVLQFHTCLQALLSSRFLASTYSSSPGKDLRWPSLTISSPNNLQPMLNHKLRHFLDFSLVWWLYLPCSSKFLPAIQINVLIWYAALLQLFGDFCRLFFAATQDSQGRQHTLWHQRISLKFSCFGTLDLVSSACPCYGP